MPLYKPIEKVTKKTSKEETMLEALKKMKVKVSYKLKQLMRGADKLTVVVIKGNVFVFQYSSSPPPRFDKMKSLLMITGEKIEGPVLEKVQKFILTRKRNKKYTKTSQGKLFI